MLSSLTRTQIVCRPRLVSAGIGFPFKLEILLALARRRPIVASEVRTRGLPRLDMPSKPAS